MTTVTVADFTTAAIHAAANAAGVGGTVIFPAGTYESDALIVSNANQVWELDRYAVIKRTANTVSSSILQINAQNFRMRGGTLDGNRYVNTQNPASGIITISNDVEFYDVTIKDVQSYGIYSQDSSLIMDRCTIKKIGLLCVLWLISENQPSRTGPSITNCVFDKGLLSDYISLGCVQITSANFGVRVYNTKFHGNTIILPVANLNTSVCLELFYNEGSSVVGNSCLGGRIGISLGHSALCTISGNNVKNCISYAIELAQGSSYNSVTGNTLYGYSKTSGFGVTVTNQANGNRVVGNVVLNYSKAVNIYKSSFTIITGN